jgi:adenosylmethionine-8-amino-7-oxononanoate aminotransferase
MEALHRRYMDTWLLGHPKIERTRICGTIAALDVKAKSESYLNATGSKLRSRFLEAGFLLRPLGNTIYLMPPYCITPSQLESVYEIIRRVVDE